MMAGRRSSAFFATSFLGAVSVLACGGSGSSKGDTTSATPAASAAAAMPEHFESVSGKFAVDFPGTWRGGYRTVERADTVAGSRFVVEFVFKPDPAWKIEPRPLLVVRIFPRAAWEKVAARPGPAMALKLAERDDDVFAYSVPSSNPYRGGTPAAARFDELVLAVAAPGSVRLTPR